MANTITAAERIEEKFGGKWTRAGSSILTPPPAVSTGSILLDEAIGECKGWPEGSIIEVYGPQHSGKTLLGYLAIAASQKKHKDREHLIIDAENQFKFQARWAQQVGVDVAKLFVTNVVSAEETFDKLEMAILGEVKLNEEGHVLKVIKPGNFGIILIDSVTQLTPLEVVNKAMDDGKRMAALASVMSTGLKKVVSAMSLVSSKTILIFVNQIRMNPQAGMFGNPEQRTGGQALAFYDTITVRVTKVSKSEERDEKGKIFAHQVKVKFEKNKAGQLSANPIVFRLRYDGTGIDKDFELFNVGRINGFIEKFDKRGNVVKAKSSDEDEVKKSLISTKGVFNFVKPDSEELLDPTIENFDFSQFQNVLTTNPKIKAMILQYIEKGSFYSDDAVIEDEVEGEPVKTEKKVEKKVETSEVVEVTEQQETTTNEAQPIQEPTVTEQGEVEHKKRGGRRKVVS